MTSRHAYDKIMGVLRGNRRVIRVHDMRQKWFSSSSAGMVKLENNLIDQDPRFQDFDNAHELLHLRVITHGSLFDSLMSAHVAGWREFDALRSTRPFCGGGCGQ